jgi:hypothetical protein
MNAMIDLPPYSDTLADEVRGFMDRSIVVTRMRIVSTTTMVKVRYGIMFM